MVRRSGCCVPVGVLCGGAVGSARMAHRRFSEEMFADGVVDPPQFLIEWIAGVACRSECGGAGAADGEPGSTTGVRHRARCRTGGRCWYVCGEAEKLVQVSVERRRNEAEAAGNWRNSMAALLERRTGPRRVPLTDGGCAGDAVESDAGACGFAVPHGCAGLRLRRCLARLLCRCRTSDAAIAFAPVTQLSHWLRMRQITSERLTRIYLERLKQYDPQLHCVITLTGEACAAAGACGGCGDRGGTVSWAAAWRAVWREGFAGHGGHRDDVRRGAVSQAGACGGCGGDSQAE